MTIENDMNKPRPPNIPWLKESQESKITSRCERGDREEFNRAVGALLLLLIPLGAIVLFIGIGYSVGFEDGGIPLITMMSAFMILMFVVGYIFKAMMFDIENQLNRNSNLEITVVQQGTPSITYGAITCRHDDLAAIYLDVNQKHCNVLTDSIHDQAPSVVLVTTSEYDPPREKSVANKEHTEIVFPQFKGFAVYASELSGNTLRICLLKKG